MTSQYPTSNLLKNRNKDVPVFAYMGDFNINIYGLDTILWAFSDYKNKYLESGSLWLIGEGKDKNELVALTKELNIEEYVHFKAEEAVIISKIDRTQLIRIITNLVKNAIQAFPENQQSKAVCVNVKKVLNNVIITVADNGLGIAKEDFNRIFEPKFTTKSSGMGLGLGIIKNIIENYKGTITLESQIGKGTTFTVSLPIINT